MFYATYSCFFIIACKSLDLNLVLTLVFSPFNANKKQKSDEMVRLRTSTPPYPQTLFGSYAKRSCRQIVQLRHLRKVSLQSLAVLVVQDRSVVQPKIGRIALAAHVADLELQTSVNGGNGLEKGWSESWKRIV